jgi:hypothetical protein
VHMADGHSDAPEPVPLRPDAAVMPRIFLSHSSEDKERVNELAGVLEELGHGVWIDNKLTGGQEWWDRILAEIRDSDYFGIVLTEASTKSEACHRECEYALALNKTVVPFQLEDDVDVEMLDPSLSRLQIIKYGSGDKAGTLQVVKALNNLPPPRPLPDPLPKPPEIPLSYVSMLLSEINRREALSQDDQIAIVFKLRDHLRGGGDSRSVEKALRHMKTRRDLYANVANEIDVILTELPAAGATRTRPVPPKPAEPSPHDLGPSERTSQGPGPRAPDRPRPHPPRDRRPPSESSKDGLGLGVLALAGLSFLIPLVGIVLYFVWNKERPQSAKWVGAAALAGAAFYLLMSSAGY